MWVISVLLLGQSAPAGRYSHCAVVYNGHMIVYGGRGFQQTEHTQKTLTTLGDVWSLNLDEMSWSLLLGAGDPSDPPDIDPLYPGQRSSHACVLLRSSEDDGELIVFGGLSGPASSELRPASADQKIQNDVWKLLLKGGGGSRVSATWEAIAVSYVSGTAPRPRSDHSMVVVDDGVLLYGGCIGSDVFSDVWLLHETGVSPSCSSHDCASDSRYEWIALDPPPAPAPPDALMPPPAPPPSNSSNASSSPRPVPDNLPPAPGTSGGPEGHGGSTGFGPTRPSPHARCAHTAAAIEGGMLLFGGRRPLPHASRDESWQTLSDTWFLDYRAARLFTPATDAADMAKYGRPVGRPPASLDGSAWRLLEEEHGESLLLNRSDHAAVLRPAGAAGGDPSLLLFGGLYTDVAQDTIYIMKDFLEMSLPAPLSGETAPPAGYTTKGGSPASLRSARTQRLPWAPQWPAWRFDHTMVVAPKVQALQTGGQVRTLRDAPVLYGGGGGMDIFSDVWVYDAEAEGWLPVSPSPAVLDRGMATSLLFGTAAFVMLVCASVCVFRRRLSRGRFGLGHPNNQPGGAEMAARDARQASVTTQAARRGLTQAQIDRLPRTAWADTAKGRSSSSSTVRSSSSTVSSGTSGRCSPSAADAVELEDLEEGTAAVVPQRAEAAAAGGGAAGEATATKAGAAKGAAKGAEAKEAAAGGAGALALSPRLSSTMTVRGDGGDGGEGEEVVEEVAASEVSEDDGDCCPVCLNGYAASELVIELPCAHVFHEQCIARWLQQEPSCPQCRYLIAPSAADAACAPFTPHARIVPAWAREETAPRASAPTASVPSPAPSSVSPAASSLVARGSSPVAVSAPPPGGTHEA